MLYRNFRLISALLATKITTTNMLTNITKHHHHQRHLHSVDRYLLSMLIVVVVMIITRNPQQQLVVAAQTGRVDCRKVVYHPYCRGISAFRTHLQMKVEQLGDDDDNNDDSEDDNDSDDTELTEEKVPDPRTSNPRHQLISSVLKPQQSQQHPQPHLPNNRPNNLPSTLASEASEKLAPGLDVKKYTNLFEWKHVIFNEYLKRNQIPPPMFIMKFGPQKQPEIHNGLRYNVDSGGPDHIENIIMEDMFYGPNGQKMKRIKPVDGADDDNVNRHFSPR